MTANSIKFRMAIITPHNPRVRPATGKVLDAFIRAALLTEMNPETVAGTEAISDVQPRQGINAQSTPIIPKVNARTLVAIVHGHS